MIKIPKYTRMSSDHEEMYKTYRPSVMDSSHKVVFILRLNFSDSGDSSYSSVIFMMASSFMSKIRIILIGWQTMVPLNPCECWWYPTSSTSIVSTVAIKKFLFTESGKVSRMFGPSSLQSANSRECPTTTTALWFIIISSVNYQQICQNRPTRTWF